MKRVNLGAHGVDGLVEVVEVGQDLGDENRVGPADSPHQGLPQRGQFLAQLAARKVGQDLRAVREPQIP